MHNLDVNIENNIQNQSACINVNLNIFALFLTQTLY